MDPYREPIDASDAVSKFPKPGAPAPVSIPISPKVPQASQQVAQAVQAPQKPEPVQPPPPPQPPKPAVSPLNEALSNAVVGAVQEWEPQLELQSLPVGATETKLPPNPSPLPTIEVMPTSANGLKVGPTIPVAPPPPPRAVQPAVKPTAVIPQVPITPIKSLDAHAAPAARPVLETVRTYQADAANAVETQHASVVTVALAEQRKKTGVEAIRNLTPEQKTRRYKSMIILSTVFLALGCLAIGFLYARLTLETDVRISTPQSNSLITAEHTHEINLENKTAEALRQEVGTTIANAQTGFTSFVFTKGVSQKALANATEVFAALRITAPAELTRSFSGAYTIGTINKGAPLPFMIFKTESFEVAFSKMLQWEGAMAESIRTGIGASSIGTEGLFNDAIISNANVRILKNIDGQTVLVYSLPDRNTVIITTTEQAMDEIIKRLTSTSYVPR